MNDKSNLNNILNPKLLELLAGVDKSKLNQVTQIVNNMSREDIFSLMNLLGNSNSNLNSKKNKSDG